MQVNLLKTPAPPPVNMSLSRHLLRQLSSTPKPSPSSAANLSFLRRDYARKVKEIRKDYIKELESQRLEKLRKDADKKEALRIANERKSAKAAKKKAEAIERQAAEEEFRRTDSPRSEAQLSFLRRDYARKVKEIRKEYIKEMESERLEKLRKDADKKEALRIANEERKAAKAAKKKAEAIERQAAEEEFRRTDEGKSREARILEEETNEN
ncbi:unnamed protein product [Fraxinus pennsylvanica]|uniref:Uncharacterized protein n=1 Tax=Fraxinus pennsylvanica TaxID=56036 RepID=A0AAD1ZYR2_9LAMI|nr:unnamed protein product [Fraxinus pennsylvanica]